MNITRSTSTEIRVADPRTGDERVYTDVDDLPPHVRELYDRAMAGDPEARIEHTVITTINGETRTFDSESEARDHIARVLGDDAPSTRLLAVGADPPRITAHFDSFDKVRLLVGLAIIVAVVVAGIVLDRVLG